MRTLILGTLPGYFNSLLIILIGILISRWQGASVYGEIAFAIAIAKIISYLFEYGLAKVALQIIPKYFAHNQHRKAKGFLYGGFIIIFSLSILFSSSSYIIYKLVTPLLYDIDFSDFVLLFIIAFAIASTRFFTCSLQGKGFFILGAVVNQLEAPILWIFMLLAIKGLRLLELNTDIILHLYLFSLLITLFIALYYVLVKFSDEVWHSSQQFEWSKWLKLGSAYTINSFSLVLTNQIAIIVLGTLSGDKTLVGVYAAIVSIVNFFHLTLTSSNSYYLPTLSGAHAKNDTQLTNQTLAQRYRYLGIMSIGYFLFLVIFGNILLSLYGKIFTEFYLALLLLGVIYAIETIVGTSVNLIVIYGHQTRAALTQFITATSVVVLTFLLTPSLLIYGAIISYAIPRIIAGIYNSTWIYLRYRLNMIRL